MCWKKVSRTLCACKKRGTFPETIVSSTTYMMTIILMTDVSGVNCQEKILPGRPYGGLAIIVRRSIADTISKVKTDSRRVCAVALNDNVDTKLTVINVYMPCDNNNAHEVNPEYQTEIDTIE